MISILMFAAAAFHCQAVDGDRIHGADLAAAVPAFSALPHDFAVGFAPLPGARRLLDPAELAGIARAHGIDYVPGIEPICFERALAPLDPAAVQAAMRKALEVPDARIDIVEMSKFPAPRGELVFSRAALSEPTASDSSIWSGYLAYDGGHFPIWARVHIAVRQKRVVSVVPLRPGHEIQANEVELQEADDFPRRTAALTDLALVIGRVPRRVLAAGTPILAASIDEPNDVSAGENTIVEVRSGAAIITIEATAETAGRRGDMISFRNPASGKVFRARVEDKGRAAIDCHPLETAQ